MARNWTEDELLVVLGLYCKLPFGQLHQRNPLIEQVAARLDRTAGSVAMKLSNLASLDPVITDSGRVGLSGASELDRRVWERFSTDTAALMPEIETRLASLLEEGAPPDAEVATPGISEATSFWAGERVATTRQRQGQNLFREAVLTAYQSRCCVTGVADTRLLLASHIKPWRDDEANRLNPRNGLCLSALVDRAFDKGLVTLSEDHRLLVSPELAPEKANPHIHETFHAREGKPISLPEKFAPEPAFLAWHREHVFLG